MPTVTPVTPSTTQVGVGSGATCSGQLTDYVNKQATDALQQQQDGLYAAGLGFATQVAGLALGEVSTTLGLAADAAGVGASALGFVTQYEGVQTQALATQAQVEGSGLPACEQEFTGTVTVDAGGAKITGNSVIDGDLGVTGSLTVGGPSPGITIGNGQITGLGPTGGIAATTGDVNAIAIGNGANASTGTSTAVGYMANASAADTSAFGANAAATAAGASAFGSGATASGINSSAFGAGAQATADRSTAIGQQATASGYASTATGQGSTASGRFSSTYGESSTASGFGSTAIGVGATATGANSVALGALSQAGSPNHATGGFNVNPVSYTAIGVNAYANGVVSVGGGAGSVVPYRQITNVADGAVTATSTDAINGSQLYASVTGLSNAILSVRKEERQGIASAVSLTSAAMPSAGGRTTYAANVAVFQGASAFGGSFAHRLDVNTPMAVTGGVSVGGAGIVTGRVGVMGEF